MLWFCFGRFITISFEIKYLLYKFILKKMTDNSNYIPSSDSQNEYSSDEVVEITQIPKL